MRIYLDSEYRCHVSDGGGMRALETALLDGKCAEYIEGFRLVPEGERWTRSDGVSFCGEMLAPWRDYAELCTYQGIYDRLLEQQSDLRAALDAIFGGETDD